MVCPVGLYGRLASSSPSGTLAPLPPSSGEALTNSCSVLPAGPPQRSRCAWDEPSPDFRLKHDMAGCLPVRAGTKNFRQDTKQATCEACTPLHSERQPTQDQGSTHVSRMLALVSGDSLSNPSMASLLLVAFHPNRLLSFLFRPSCSDAFDTGPFCCASLRVACRRLG